MPFLISRPEEISIAGALVISMAFSIFSADLHKRKENSSNNFERPKGSSSWLSRAVIQERQIIRKIIGQI